MKRGRSVQGYVQRSYCYTMGDGEGEGYTWSMSNDCTAIRRKIEEGRAIHGLCPTIALPYDGRCYAGEVYTWSVSNDRSAMRRYMKLMVGKVCTYSVQ